MSENKNTTRFQLAPTFKLTALATATALFLGLAGNVYAQNENQDDEAGLLEEVVVTGTRKVGRLPTETLSPVDVISGQALEFQAQSDLTETLTKLTPALSTQRFPIADGTAFVRPVVLRNLSPDQTLVLVDGTRRHRSALVNLQLAPLGTVNQGSQAVDFSAFPASAIKRVEVLRDGASAQYGSDAIAGVINVILKDDREGGSINGQYGKYTEGDGERINFNANVGLPLGDEGFINLSYEYSTSEPTSRGQARPDAAGVGDIVGDSLVPYNGLGQYWGDPDIEANKFFLNAGIPFSNGMELFGNASYMDKETIGGFFYRGPVLPPEYEFAARSTLMQDLNGDFLPDPASQQLVDDIIGAGLNPADYITADPNSPSGWVLLNPIHTMFPGGYSPTFGATIKDWAVVVGLRGDFNSNLSWNLRARTSENEISYQLDGSINPSLGRLSPTSFNPGTLTQEESGVNLDFVKTFDDSPLNLAFGLEWRDETYLIGAGDIGSTQTGPTFIQFGVGSDGFQGFTTTQSGSWSKNSSAAYIDLESDITERLSGALAARYEDHDGFGSTTTWKISARYQFTDGFAIRSTYNTGFRVPTPGQVNTLNLTTSADENGNLIPSGFYPVDHPVARALGARPQETEESQNFTIGLVWEASDNVAVTLDFYDITIEDRIGSLDKTVDQGAVDRLVAAGFPNAQLLLGSSASYFSNAFDSEVTGIDLTVDTFWDIWNGTMNAGFRYNYNEQDVTNIKPGTINQSRAYDLENQVPNHRGVLSFDWTNDRWGGLLRFNYYGSWSTTGGLFSPGDASDASEYGSEILVDLEARFNISETFTVALGGDNIFDTYPDDEQDGVFQFLGVIHSVTSPFGFNGASWYIRGTASF
jgi:iron complex outermembrane receptor protein